MKLLFILFTIVLFYSINCQNDKISKPNYFEMGYHAVIRSCKGCALGQLTEVKNFILNDLSNYPVDIIYLEGDPHFVIVDDLGNEIMSRDISTFSREKIGRLFEAYGYKKFDN